jgi:hypothetical protein
MAATAGHAGIAAFLSEQVLLLLMKENSVATDEAANARAPLA